MARFPTDPKDTSEIPEVSPEKRGTLWNACYAAAFLDEYRLLRNAAGLGYTIDTFVERNAVCAAEYAKTMADIAVWALKAWGKEQG